MNLHQVRLSCLFSLLTTFWCASSSMSDEGMYPVSELQNLDLKSRGIDLTAEEVFHAKRISLVDGICRVNGCTGSFISEEGLIITNHHCAYEAIQQASLHGNDLLANGFQASDRNQEIPAPGYVVRITESYRDVSQEVLSVVVPGMDFLARTEAIRRQSRLLEKESEQQHPGLRAEVAEMFAGKTYGLFLYTYLRDVRLVFAPPSSIGTFGGEVDNWEWPRHTGDFALMRAYAAPNGSSREYQPENVPFRPKRFIQVNPQGVNANDAVFLLGYPGRTVRHRTASFIQYEQESRLPLTAELFGWQIAQMTSAGQQNRTVELKMLARLKSLANVEKRSRGQLQGLHRAQILLTRQTEERQLQAFIEEDADRHKKYGHVLSELEMLYQTMQQQAAVELIMDQLRTAPRLAAAAWFLIDAANERAKPEPVRESAYIDKNYDQTLQLVRNGLRDFHVPTEKTLLRGLFQRLSDAQESLASESITPINVLQPALIDVNQVDSLVDRSLLGQVDFLEQCLQLSPQALAEHTDSMLSWMQLIYPNYLAMREVHKRREGQLNELYGLLLSVKQEWLMSQFIPDANGTLRLTSGRVRGYSPVDGILKTPQSTFRGVVEKTTGKEPFQTPQHVMEVWRARHFGHYAHPGLNDIPVCILYDTDTTGGNSGSPVLNGNGQLVGVNFDRCYEATINDFAWNANYSRSIGVDIRYVLWLIDTVYGAKHLISEMLQDR